jgi:hypothetical protein
MGTAVNDISIWGLGVNGPRYNTATWLTYSQGPIRFGTSYNWHKAERDFRADFGDEKFDDAKIDVFLVRTGLFIWGPDGFLSGSENGGLMLAYNHFRNYFDGGSDHNERTDFEDSGRKLHVIQNIGLLRYFYKPNVIFAVEYQASKISKLAGPDHSDTRRRTGVGRDGGTYQTITLAMKLNF